MCKVCLGDPFESRLNGSLESHSIILYLQWIINGLFSTHQYLEVKSPLMVYSLRRGEERISMTMDCNVVFVIVSINWK